MTGLKLAKLPDRTPIKITISVGPELHTALRSYANAYRNAYEIEEKIEILIPAMLDLFLISDKQFAKARKSENGG